MKLARAIMCVGVSCGSLVAQQVPIARQIKPIAFPAAAAEKAPTVLSTGVTGLPAGFGLAPGTTLYDAAIPQDQAAVCTELKRAAALAPPSEYAFVREQFTPTALKAAFTHDNLVKMAHNFVPGQPLPDAPVPLTPRQKFQGFVNSSYSVQLGVNILSDALISQATGAYPKFGGGMKGFGQRLGVSAAGAETAAFFGGFVYPTLFHQDPRFYPSRQHSVIDRLAYAASRALIGRSDSGRSVINSSVIASQFTEAAISNAYIPYRNETVSGTIENALTGLLGVVEGNIVNEFWPDFTEFAWRRTHSEFVKKGMELGDPTGVQNYPRAVASSQ